MRSKSIIAIITPFLFLFACHISPEKSPQCKTDNPFDMFPGEVRIAAVGDMMFSRRVQINMDTLGYDIPLQDVSNYLYDFDITTGNLESPICDIGSPMDKKYVFRANPRVIPELKKSGFDVLTIANNHAFDWGLDCFLRCKTLLNSTGIQTVGGGCNLEESLEPATLEINGLSFAFLGFNDTRTNYIGRNRPACTPAYDKWVFQAIDSTVEKCDYLIVHIHWGEEYYPYPTERQKKLAHSMIDRGVSLVIGHHPHRWEGVEFYRDGLIAYSLGNFLFDQNDLDNNISGILEVTFDEKGISNVEIKPVEMLTRPREVKFSEMRESFIFEGLLRESCSIFPTEVIREDEKLILRDMFQ